MAKPSLTLSYLEDFGEPTQEIHKTRHPNKTEHPSIALIPLVQARLAKGPIVARDAKRTFGDSASGGWHSVKHNTEHLTVLATVPHTDPYDFLIRREDQGVKRKSKTGFALIEEVRQAYMQVVPSMNGLAQLDSFVPQFMRYLPAAQAERVPFLVGHFLRSCEPNRYVPKEGGLTLAQWFLLQNSIYDALGQNILELSVGPGDLVLVGRNYFHFRVSRTMDEMMEPANLQRFPVQIKNP
jgi:hypothetical protein